MRNKTKEIKIGKLICGGGNRILIQSMTNVSNFKPDAVKEQINSLVAAGCDIVRLAVTSPDEISAIKNILKNPPVPLVADIQFDYRLAVASADAGFSKIRFNPGNIGSESAVQEVVAACKRNKVPIRIGVNSGSLEKDILNQFGKSGQALADSALKHVALLEKHGFYDIVLSAKASRVKETVDAYRILNEKSDYPLHLGVTESGRGSAGLTKSAIGIGALLIDSIGDTVRVSLSGDPVEEIAAAKAILKAAGRLNEGVEIVSCPTCSRCDYDLTSILKEIETYTAGIKKPLKIAVMGCVVNGPGEAADADMGVAGGKEKSVLFKEGKLYKTISNCEIVAELKKLIDEFLHNDK